MNSNLVLAALNDIAAESSKKTKETLVEKFLSDESDTTFKNACLYAFSPFYVFGVLPTKADEAVEAGELFFDEVNTFGFLDRLNSRELTGNAARAELASQLGQLSKESGELLIRILRKDLRAGFGASTINKGLKDFIPVFPYQRCSLPKDTDLSKWPWSKGVFSQEKADGMFANGTVVKGGVLTLSSRQGTPFPMEAFADLQKDAMQLRDDFQYHGEILVVRDGKVLPREIGNGVLNSVLKGGSFAENEHPIYQVWDMIPMRAVKSKGKFEAAYLGRFTVLERMTKPCQFISAIDTKLVFSLADAYEHYGELLKQGKEGTVLKHPDGHWKDGTSKEQIKLKLEADCELEIMSINLGAIGTKNEGRAGALHCKSACGQLIVDVAVKNEKMRDEVDAAPDEWVGKIITVRANQVLNPSASNSAHSLFLPRMVEDSYRTDKSDADTLERIKAQFLNAVSKAA